MGKRETAPVYTIRKDGQQYTQSKIPNCGYSDRMLRQMQKARYILYKDGKRVKIGAG